MSVPGRSRTVGAGGAGIAIGQLTKLGDQLGWVVDVEVVVEPAEVGGQRDEAVGAGRERAAVLVHRRDWRRNGLSNPVVHTTPGGPTTSIASAPGRGSRGSRRWCGAQGAGRYVTVEELVGPVSRLS
jgi:hypothetical protein